MDEDWDDYATVLGEVLRAARPGAEVALRVPGGRHLTFRRSVHHVAGHLSDAHSTSAHWRLTPADGDALTALGWRRTPQGYALEPEDLHEHSERVSRTAVATLRRVLRVGVPGEVVAGAHGAVTDVSVLRFPLPPAAVLDTSGWTALPDGSALDESTGGRTTLETDLEPPDDPHWLDDLDAARRALARDHAATGCLISADPVTVGSITGLAQLYKTIHPALPVISYGLSIWFLRATRAVHVRHVIPAPPPPDPRTSATTPPPPPHPYDPTLTTALPYLPSDEDPWDPLYPTHPLTHARTWLHTLPHRLKLTHPFTTSPTYHPTPSPQLR
ncbi:TY-Chap domain-containing protein [Actinocorallia sp. A-T 12471]|uniref:TY-Chap domain-containing protein n=1 Tax=Actinocorallia sp. A-T 12471 TaxID=3089813 RepID=UPI0029D19A6A|nr:hypothetical protein [Actinocorallia sp. A-T 12471]MDX6738760.1 hypothetical protein [Actinocorallia sp. A-T 12471]